MTAPDLSAAASVVELADAVVQQAARHLAPFAEGDEKQVVLYDVAHAAAGGRDRAIAPRLRREG